MRIHLLFCDEWKYDREWMKSHAVEPEKIFLRKRSQQSKLPLKHAAAKTKSRLEHVVQLRCPQITVIMTRIIHNRYLFKNLEGLWVSVQFGNPMVITPCQDVKRAQLVTLSTRAKYLVHAFLSMLKREKTTKVSKIDGGLNGRMLCACHKVPLP